jgi:hypothetical protein
VVALTEIKRFKKNVATCRQSLLCSFFNKKSMKLPYSEFKQVAGHGEFPTKE